MQPPTADEILNDTFIGIFGFGDTLDTVHQWAVEGGTIHVRASQLRPALEAAYYPNMANWLSLISWDDADGFFVA